MDKVPMTPDGHAAMHTELAHLKSVERPRISKEIGIAREHGDLRENAEYHAAKDKQGMIEARIRELEDKIARAEVIDPSGFSGAKIKFGAFVALQDADSGKKVQYRIVGPDEASMEKGSISVTAPLARALIGRQAGDEVTVTAPGGERTWAVLRQERVDLCELVLPPDDGCVHSCRIMLPEARAVKTATARARGCRAASRTLRASRGTVAPGTPRGPGLPFPAIRPTPAARGR